MTVKRYITDRVDLISTELHNLEKKIIEKNKLAEWFIAIAKVGWELFPDGNRDCYFDYVFEFSEREKKATCLLALGRLEEE